MLSLPMHFIVNCEKHSSLHQGDTLQHPLEVNCKFLEILFVHICTTFTGAQETEDGSKKIPNYHPKANQYLLPRRNCGWAASDRPQ